MLAGDFKLAEKELQTISTGGVVSCEKILRTCDTPSATCSVFQSSSLRDKLQEKLPRVTWPLEGKRNLDLSNRKFDFVSFNAVP